MDNKEDISIVSEYGTKVTARFEVNDTVVINIVIQDGDECYTYVIVAVIPELDRENADLYNVLYTIVLPFVFHIYIADPFLRLKLFYEFGLVEVVGEGETVKETGDYYIAVDRLFDSGVRQLDIVGCCPDGTSYFTPESALTAYKLLELHSYGEDCLPIMEEDQTYPTRFYLFRYVG